MIAPWTDPPIALVSPRYAHATGGVERYVERLAAGLRARGIPVEIVTTDPALERPSLERLDGVIVRRFPTLFADRVFYPSPALARWLGRHAGRYALLHAHGLHTLLPLAAAWSARTNQTPLVLTPHWHGTGHTPIRRLLHVPYRPVAGLVARSAVAVIGNSQGEAEQLARDFGAALPMTVIPEGIELPEATLPAGSASVARFRDASARVTILSVGRLESYKGVDRVVRALAFLPADVRLVIVGHGPAVDAIRATATEVGVVDRVLVRGRVPDEELRSWYDYADVSVSLSAYESFGLSVLEAAASGMPVVASDIPAHRESRSFLPDGRIILTPIHGSPDTTAAAITTALAQGRATDRSGWMLPTWDSLVDQTLDVYRQVLRDR